MTRKRLASLDDARASLRRTQILEAATRVFAAKGYHRATTKDVARAADIAEGTIYLYFKSKSDLLIALLEHLDRQTTQTADLAAGLELSARELLTQRLRHDLAQLGPSFDVMLALLPEVLADRRLRNRFYDRIVLPGIAGVAQHMQARRDAGQVVIPDVPMASRILVAALLGLELLSVLGDEVVRAAWADPARLAESIAQVLFDGLQPEGRP